MWIVVECGVGSFFIYLVQLGVNVFRDVLLTAQLLEVLRYSIETWNEFTQRNT
jgi:hypothetical protein